MVIQLQVSLKGKHVFTTEQFLDPVKAREAYDTLALALPGYTIECLRIDLTIFRFNDWKKNLI